MLKKFILTFSVLVCLFSVSVFALEAPDDFYVYGENTKQLAEALGMDDSEIENYCNQNSITFLAVNKDNTKQIRQTVSKDSFSEKIGNLSVLSDEDILSLSGDLSSVSNVKGEVVNKNDQKYLKIEAKTEDSGGEYILTQYITVKDGEKTVLTFYTDIDTDKGYIEEVFNSQLGGNNTVKYVVIAGVVLFSLAAAVVLALIIRDILKRKTED